MLCPVNNGAKSLELPEDGVRWRSRGRGARSDCSAPRTGRSWRRAAADPEAVPATWIIPGSRLATFIKHYNVRSVVSRARVKAKGQRYRKPPPGVRGLRFVVNSCRSMSAFALPAERERHSCGTVVPSLPRGPSPLAALRRDLDARRVSESDRRSRASASAQRAVHGHRGKCPSLIIDSSNASHGVRPA